VQAVGVASFEFPVPRVRVSGSTVLIQGMRRTDDTRFSQKLPDWSTQTGTCSRASILALFFYFVESNPRAPLVERYA